MQKKKQRNVKKKKKQRKSDAELDQMIRRLTLMSDAFFKLFAEDAAAIEELLQVVMEDPEIRIKPESVKPQYEVNHLGKRGVRVDVYAEDLNEAIYNIEIQNEDNTDHIRRVRYHVATLTVKCSEPGDAFSDVQILRVIYISDFDIFNAGFAVYHAETIVRETGKPLDDGVEYLFVNTETDDGSKIARYLKHFTEKDFNDPEFPQASRRMYEMKHDEKEVRKMKDIWQEYAERYAEKKTKQKDAEIAKRDAALAESEAALQKKEQRIEELEKKLAAAGVK